MFYKKDIEFILSSVIFRVRLPLALGVVVRISSSFRRVRRG
jgi:hypothetical protein